MPVCDALQQALRSHEVPEQILTDNGKVFTARFGPITSICHNSIARPRSHRR
jgi:hypothetical protein